MNKKGSCATENQKKVMLEYLKKNPNLISGKFSVSFTFKNCEEKWKELSDILNSIPGAKKEWKNWRKTWQDIRSRRKIKYANAKKTGTRTGGGSPVPAENFTKTEEDILETIKAVSVEGHQGVKESKVEFDDLLSDAEDNTDSINVSKELCTENEKTAPELEHIKPSTSKVTGPSSSIEESTLRNVISKNSHKIPKRTPIKLKHTNAAVEAYGNMVKVKTQVKENYFKEKLLLLKRDVEAKERNAAALEKIAEILEKIVD